MTIENSGVYSVGEEYLSKMKPQTVGNANISYIRDPPSVYISFKPQKDISTSAVKVGTYNSIQKSSKALNRIEVTCSAASLSYSTPGSVGAATPQVQSAEVSAQLADAITSIVNKTDIYGIRLYDLQEKLIGKNIALSSSKLRDALNILEKRKALYVMPLYDTSILPNDLILAPEHASLYMIRDAFDGFCCWCHVDGSMNYPLFFALIARVICHLQSEPKSNVYQIRHCIMFLPLAQCWTLLRRMVEMNLIEEETILDNLVSKNAFDYNNIMDIINAPSEVCDRRTTPLKSVYFSLKMSLPTLP